MNKFLVVRPHISEKAAALTSARQYAFIVSNVATKPAIRRAIKDASRVDVERVRVINLAPKQRHLGRSTVINPGFKKAIVTLREGQKLDILPT